MELSEFSPAVRDQVERILAYTPASELYAIPCGEASPNPRPRVGLKWLEAGLLMGPTKPIRGFRAVRTR